MLGPGRLQLPHNAMTKLGVDVVHFSHHSPSPFSSSAVRRLMKVRTSSTMSLSVATQASLNAGRRFDFDPNS
jgi:hypothetical protein